MWITTKDVVLGLYIPIVLFSLAAVVLLLVRLIIPAFYQKKMNLGTYSIALSSLFSLASHALENSWYGVIRWNNANFQIESLPNRDDIWVVLGIGKIFILISTLFAVVALMADSASPAWTPRNIFTKGTALALILWGLSTLLSASL